MHILTRWSSRIVRANISRTITVVLAVVGFFALWVCSAFIADAAVHTANVTGSKLGVSAIDFTEDYLFKAMVDYVYVGLSLIMITILYSIFSVTADECLKEYRILTSSGVTMRQTRRNLLLRAVVLSLIGAVIGILLGFAAALVSLATRQISAFPSEMQFAELAERILTGTRRFFHELPYFVRDPRVLLMLLIGLLLAPSMMLLASALAFRRKQKSMHPQKPKRELFHRSTAHRLLGTGATLGRLSSKKNRRYRAIFTISFSVCLAVLALLDNTLSLFAIARPMRQNFDLYFDCMNFSVDAPASGSDVLDDLLRQNADLIRIKSSVTFLERLDWGNNYVLLDSSRISESFSFRFMGEPFERDGRSVRLCKLLFSFGFLDDAAFDELAQKYGIETGADGAILYNNMHVQDVPDSQTPVLKSVDPHEDVTVHFVPYAFLQNTSKVYERTQSMFKPIMNSPDENFLRAAEPESVQKSFRILGLLDTLPYDMESPYPILIFPMRMYDSFEQPLSKLNMTSDYTMQIKSRKRYYFVLSDPAAGIEPFLQAARLDPRLEISESLFGMGYRPVMDAEEMTGESGSVLASVGVTDLFNKRDRLDVFQSAIPEMRAILLVMSGWILFVGILNTAHMNRLTRRREKAILESIGMGTRQKTGMLLYESARYALSSALIGWLGFLAVFRITWEGIQWLLYSEGLLVENAGTSGYYQKELFYTHEMWGHFLRSFAEAFVRTWWIFFVGAALIFVLLVVTDMYIDRRSHRDELIQILKDDTTDDFS